jgi:high-affinity Fe2+/Pb2+ permease
MNSGFCLVSLFLLFSGLGLLFAAFGFLASLHHSSNSDWKQQQQKQEQDQELA